MFSFPSPRRERDARRVLNHPAVPVATASRTPGTAPDAAIWLPVPADRARPDHARLGLAQLAHIPLEVT